MTVAALARRPASLEVRLGDSGDTDPYNNDLGLWQSTPTLAFASQRRSTEVTEDGGLVASEDWTLVWADDLPAAASDRLVMPGIGTFELTGAAVRVVRPQTNRFSHFEATGRMVT